MSSNPKLQDPTHLLSMMPTTCLHSTRIQVQNLVNDMLGDASAQVDLVVICVGCAVALLKVARNVLGDLELPCSQ